MTPDGDALDSARADAARVVDDLLAELDAIAGSTEACPDDEHDAEGSTVGYQRARVKALLRVAEARLTLLEGAVAGRRDGGAPRCATCGAELAAARVLALPGVTSCAACAGSAGADRLHPGLRGRRTGDALPRGYDVSVTTGSPTTGAEPDERSDRRTAWSGARVCPAAGAASWEDGTSRPRDVGRPDARRSEEDRPR